MIRTLLIILFCSLLSSVSLANQSAERAIIGFSPDGKWFAFEEFGTSDGTGAPYSRIFILDTVNDKWAPGSPVRINYGENPAPVSKARRDAMRKAAPILKRLNIGEPGILLASNPVTEIVANSRRINFYRHMSMAYPENRQTYLLREIGFATPNRCQGMEVAIKGFSLSYSKAGSTPNIVYRDRKIPKSRGCPVRYGIADVIEFNAPRRLVHVVLIHLYARGFEGPDTSFLAIPVMQP